MSQKESKLEFVLRKLQSLSGILPLAVFLLFHLVANALAMIDVGLYNQFINIMSVIPGLIIIEIIVIFAPLLVHGLMGLYIVITGRNNPKRYAYFRNWAFMLQRISGVIIFAFLIWHVATIKFGSEHNSLMMIANLYDQMHFTPTAVFYIVSLIAVSFHVCNGLWGFAINWGILPGMRAQKVFGYVCIALFVVLLIFWVAVFNAISGIEADMIEYIKLLLTVM